VEVITVETRRLDDLLSPDHEVDFVKVDVEGGELGVFRGATRTLSKWRPLIAFEHGGKYTGSEYGMTPEMVFEELASVGLSISMLDDWLNRGPTLSVDQFVDKLSEHHWFFLAHPRV
jgi:hypothetical protein